MTFADILQAAAKAGGVAVAGVKEVTRFDLSALDGASFVTAGEGLALIISNQAQKFGIWFQVEFETQPDLSGQGVTQYQVIGINPLGDADECAGSLRTGLSILGYAVSSVAGGIFSATDAATGDREDAADVSSMIGITITLQGS